MENQQQPESRIPPHNPSQPSPNYSTQPSATGDPGKTAAIVSYITIIGWLVSYFALYNDNKTPLARFHMRQSLLIHIVHVTIGLIQSMIWLGWGIYSLLSLVSLAFLILLIIGLINAASEQTKPLPLIGEPAQRMFSNI